MKTIIGISFATLLVACGDFDRSQAGAVVQSVGAERIRAAAQTLTAFINRNNGEVPPEKWPKAFQELNPKSVRVEESGVYVSISGFYVQGQGLYIVFRGKREPEERWGDPSFWKIVDRIFWYEFTG